EVKGEDSASADEKALDKLLAALPAQLADNQLIVIALALVWSDAQIANAVLKHPRFAAVALDKKKGFYQAIALSGDQSTIERILKKYRFIPNIQDAIKDARGANFFHYVAWSGNLNTIQWLLENRQQYGFDSTAIDRFSANFFFYVARSGNLKTIQWLL